MEPATKNNIARIVNITPPQTIAIVRIPILNFDNCSPLPIGQLSIVDIILVSLIWSTYLYWIEDKDVDIVLTGTQYSENGSN